MAAHHEPAVKIENVEMSKEMQEVSVDVATEVVKAVTGAGDKPGTEKEIARRIKEELVKRYGSNWNCIVGRNFGSHVTYEKDHFIYLYVGARAILIFKSA